MDTVWHAPSAGPPHGRKMRRGGRGGGLDGSASGTAPRDLGCALGAGRSIRARTRGASRPRVGAMASALGAGGNAFWAVTWPDRGLAGWPRATVARWRRAIGRSLDHHLSPAARELVVPLVLGDRSGLSTDLGAELRASGLIHLLALSGLHVAWMAAIARGMLAALGRGVLGRAIAGAACAILYLGIAGPLPSLARAAASELLKSAGLARGRPIDPLQAMAVSVLAMVAL